MENSEYKSEEIYIITQWKLRFRSQMLQIHETTCMYLQKGCDKTLDTIQRIQLL